jgi:O-antigen ligase
MNPPTPSPAPARTHAAGEWLVTAGLAAVIAWTTLNLGGYRPETLVVSGTAVLVLAATWALGWALRPGRLEPADWLPVPFLVFALASVLWLAPTQWLAWREWLLWLQTWLVFLLVRHGVRTPAQIGLLTGTVLALAVVGAGMAAYQRFVDPKWIMMGRTQAEQFFGRSAGMFGIPNSLAALVELVLPACLLLLLQRSTGLLARIFCGWLAALLLFALVLTGSRGGWISLSLVLLLWPLLGGRNWRWRVGGAAAVLGLVSVSLALLYRFSTQVHNRMQPFLDGQFELSRPLVWRGALRIWRDHVWLGSGAASFNVLFEQVRPRGFLNEPQWTHNDYLNTLGDYGVAGLILWVAAGAGLLWLGWRAVQQARAQATVAPLLESGPVRLGLWLGLVAYALHLAVDFHTKIPALACLSALSTGLLLRPQRQDGLAKGPAWSRLMALLFGLGLLALAGLKALPLYRAETERYAARQAIDKQAATGQGSGAQIAQEGLLHFRRAVELDPGNGQAWSDLAYATILTWESSGVSLAESGRRALQAADRAVHLCPVSVEFWVRKGVALDMIPEQKAADACFKRAGELAPYTPEWLYYQAYHWAAWPGHEADARRCLDTCLSLDPNYPPAIRLRERIHALPR